MLYNLEMITAITGLTLPGYLLARSLGLRHSWVVAFPFSALILVELVTFFSILHLNLRFWPMISMLTLLSVSSGLTAVYRKSGRICESPLAGKDDVSRLLLGASVGVAVLIVLAVLFRSVSYPLSGSDTFFRWEGLARLILVLESLDFYPPVTPHDYSIYLWPDGIPPLVASVYWWIYAAIGQPVMQATSMSVAMQLVSAMALTFYGASYTFGYRAACFSLVAFSSSALLINGFAIGQETGYTALAVAGQFCFASLAVRCPGAAPVIAAAMFASLGALSRDYGPALAIAGFLVLALHKDVRRYVWLYTLMTLLLSSPWYLRNWAVAGNPFYPHAIPGGFKINALYVTMMNSCNETLAFYRYNFKSWISFISDILIGAPVAIAGGASFLAVRKRESIPYCILAVLTVILWLFSMGKTIGGPLYSMRVLTPAFVSLSILAGATLAWLFDNRSGSFRWGRISAICLMTSASLYSLSSALSHPFSPKYLLAAISYRFAGPPELAAGSLYLSNKLEESDLPATGVLTNDVYFGTNLQRGTRFRPVMVWSPEVEFLFDKKLDPEEIKRRLIALNIRIFFLSADKIFFPFLDQSAFYRRYRQQDAPGRLVGFGGPGYEALYYLQNEDDPR